MPCLLWKETAHYQDLPLQSAICETHTHTYTDVHLHCWATPSFISPSAQTNTISWPPHTLPSDIFWHQSLWIPLFFSGLQMRTEEKQRREKVMLPISPALIEFFFGSFGSVLIPEILKPFRPTRYLTARVVGGWSWLYSSCKNKQRVGKCAVCCWSDWCYRCLLYL